MKSLGLPRKWRLNIGYNLLMRRLSTIARGLLQQFVAPRHRHGPGTGDVVRLQGEDNTWRRRVGSYRIIFEIDIKGLAVDVLDVARRTSTAC